MTHNLIDKVALDFNDVLIRPELSHISSRSEIDLNVKHTTGWSQRTISGIPIISANMSSVSTMTMAKKLSQHNLFCALHKHYSINELNEFYESLTDDEKNHIFLSFGIKDEGKLGKLNFSPSLINLDVAHGGMLSFHEFAKRIRIKHPDAIIMAGNVATYNTAKYLYGAGVDIVKCGIGSGAGCTTRVKTGVGVPQLTAIFDCLNFKEECPSMLLCSDGGITKEGDFAIAFVAGADFVMAGSMFAGHTECELPVEDGMIEYYGMSSSHAMNKHYGKKESYRASEGRYTKIPFKGSVDNTVEEILGGIRSACSYVGSIGLQHISSYGTLIRVNNTHNKTLERYTHE